MTAFSYLEFVTSPFNFVDKIDTFFCEFAVSFCVQFLILQNSSSSLVIVAFRLSWRVWKAVNAGWLAGVFMKKQLALSFALGLAFNRFQCQFIRQLPIDHHACLLPVLVFLDKKFLVLFHLLLFNYFQLILCLDSL